MQSLRGLSQLVLGYLALYTTAKSASRQPPLLFGSDGTFKLVVLADLHYGERDGERWAQWGEDQDRNSTRVMTHVLDDELPDFVVFGGDMVTGENLWRTNATEYLSLAIAPTADRNLPFATIYGNHDNSKNITHPLLYFHEQKHYSQLSRTRETPDSATDQAGRFNYYTEVFSSTKDITPSVILWFFDSRSGIFDDPTQYEDWVDAKSAEWMRSTVANLTDTYGGALPPSLVFVHIPPSATVAIQALTVSPNATYPGLNDDDPVDPQGQNHPELRRPDLPFWNAVVETLGDGLIATVVGHDHGNDWCAKSATVPHTVCFARHTGYGGYGSRPRGSRVIEFTLPDRTVRGGGDQLRVESWIRLEDHTVENPTTLR